jgi:PhzF family phenazine biosynthesis protein
MTAALVNVFTHEGAGGNPCPVVCDAAGMADGDMQAVAREHGHESGFVLPAPGPEYDYRFRYFVPNHEMEMCGHATVGALWLLARANRLPAARVRISTLSGTVTGFIGTGDDGLPAVEITQPAGGVRALDEDATRRVLDVLGLSRGELLDLPVQNAVTSRVKTIVPARSLETLQRLRPDFGRIEAVCDAIGSTGLYPYAPHGDDAQTFDARQFPRSSGYPEDAATGIAATALGFGLLENGLIERSPRPVRIMKGRAMGHLSRIDVRIGFAGDRAVGCLVGGAVSPA